NLLGNAVKFTEHGAITIHISSMTEEHTVRIFADVEDTGPGIKEEELDKLFRYFEQTETGLLTNGGTGLGLPISREYARLLGGDITVTSRPGYGSIFRFEFDAMLSSEKVVADRTPERHVVGLQDKEREYSVLVSDDIASNRLLLRDLLANIGFRVFTATNGQEAVKVFQAEKPDIILMDNRMPDMTGQEATQRIKQLPDGKDVGIISISASVFDDDRDKILSSGADDFVRKPIEEKLLFDAMKKILGIEYRYEGECKPTQELDLTTCRKALSVLPKELTRQMRQLILEGDLEELGNLLEQVQPYDRHLSESLHILINGFELKKLQTIFS
ncbi:MAG: response regulator, partial [Candidatus Electrothrix sp. ATG2]|nr:response regulator [Candidatus Electrothrix sp. ATG2]